MHRHYSQATCDIQTNTTRLKQPCKAYTLYPETVRTGSHHSADKKTPAWETGGVE